MTPNLSSVPAKSLKRTLQTSWLRILFCSTTPSPATSVLYGPQDANIIETLQAAFEQESIESDTLTKRCGLKYAIVKGRECLSQRQLLSKIWIESIKAYDALDEEEITQISYDGSRVDGLLVALEKLLQWRDEQKPAVNFHQDAKFVIVLEAISELPFTGSSSTTNALLAALARLGQHPLMAKHNVSIIFVNYSSRPVFLQKPGVTYLRFPAYIRAEMLSMALLPDNAPIFAPESYVDSFDDGHWHTESSRLLGIYEQFVTTVYDTVIMPTTSDTLQLIDLCHLLWPRFIWPVISHEPPPGRARTWDFSRLLVKNRALFQHEAETLLVNRLHHGKRTAHTFEELAAATDAAPPQEPSQTSRPQPLLTFYATLVLTAAYLASHTPPKLDTLLFCRLTSNANTKRHRVKKSYHRRNLFPNPSDPSTAAAPSKSNSVLDGRAGLPKPFLLERLLAILRAIHPKGVDKGKAQADKVYRTLGELERLRLVVPVGAYGDDDEKWRINVSRGWVEGECKKQGFGFGDFEV